MKQLLDVVLRHLVFHVLCRQRYCTSTNQALQRTCRHCVCVGFLFLGPFGLARGEVTYETAS